MYFGQILLTNTFVMTFIPRLQFRLIEQSLDKHPVTLVTGPRQSGKTTLAKEILSGYAHRYKTEQKTVYLDLENYSELMKLDEPEWFFHSQADKLICIDEIQNLPDIYPLLQKLVEKHRRNGMYLILGSAERELLKQDFPSTGSSISTCFLPPMLMEELPDGLTMESRLYRGGFVPPLSAANDLESHRWYQEYINRLVQRDLPQLAGVGQQTMHRLLHMLAHTNGQAINFSRIGKSLGVSHNTVRNYVHLLEQSFVVMLLHPWQGDTSKRLVRSPKVFIADTGLTCALLQLKRFDAAYGHPVWASLWESLVLQHLRYWFPDMAISFYRTSYGNEISIIIEWKSLRISLFCKTSMSPEVSAVNRNLARDINSDMTFIAAPVQESYPLDEGIIVSSVNDMKNQISGFLV